MKPLRSVLASAAVLTCAVVSGATITWVTQSSATTSAITPTIYTVTASGILQSGGETSVGANCNPGDKATGGGYSWEGVPFGGSGSFFIESSSPANSGSKHNVGWVVTAIDNGTAGPVNLYTYAQCLKRS